ncbi:MAG: signal peptidase II [Synergistaceae bacterium]|nr:signal peptidase II [Synergistaceae bacterium]
MTGKRIVLSLALAADLQILSAIIRALDLPVTWNRGVALSAFGASATTTALGLAGLAGITALCRQSRNRFTPIGLILLWAGTVSNAVDRLRFGAVMDYLPLPLPLTLPAPLPSLPTTVHLNGADLALIAGGLLILLGRRAPKRRSRGQGPPRNIS